MTDTTTIPQPTRDPCASPADRVTSLMLLALACAMGYMALSGTYTQYTTPRTLPYIIIATILLTVLGSVAWTGAFHATPQSMQRLLIGIVIPMLLISFPPHPEQTASDQYAGGRPIAIRPHDHLHGMDAKTRTLHISDDEFGSWYEYIDSHPAQFQGYTITATGFISSSSTTGKQQFRLSRMLMTCCILDMTPFGFTVDTSRQPSDHQQDPIASKTAQDGTWVTITGTLEPTSIGAKGHTYEGMALHATSISSAHAVSGYYYRP